jgi:hypothetical protein
MTRTTVKKSYCLTLRTDVSIGRLVGRGIDGVLLAEVAWLTEA